MEIEDILLLGLLALTIVLAINSAGSNSSPEYSIQGQCDVCNEVYGLEGDYNAAFIDKLDEIQQNCGTLFITKPYGNDTYHLFKRKTKDGWGKTEYIPLEECMEG